MEGTHPEPPPSPPERGLPPRSGSTAGRRVLLAFGAILLAGAIVRGAYVAEVRLRPDFARPRVDALFHDYWARGLATGQWAPPPPHQDPRIGENPYFRPPGYPHFLAGVHRLSGGDPLAPRLVQMLLGLGLGLLLFFIGWRWFGAGAGLAAAALAVLSWSLVYFEGELLEPSLLSALLVALVGAAGLWAERPTLPRGALAGGLLGLSILVRPNVALFLPVLLAWGWRAIAPALGRARALGHAATVAAACAAIIAPATVRNHLAAGEFVLVSTNSGINLFIGNNDGATGECASSIEGLGRYATCFDYLPLVNLLSGRMGRELTQGEASAIFSRAALAWVREHPLGALRLVGRKTLLFWGPLQVSHNREDEIDREESAVLRLLPVGFPLVFSLAILGATLLLCLQPPGGAPSGRRMVALLSLLAAAYFASFLPFFVAGRYRVPLIPLLALLGAAGVDALRQRWTAGERGRVAAAVILLAALWAAASVNWAGYRPDRSRWHYDNALDLIAGGDVRGALAEFERAVEVNPGNPRAQSDLGSAYAVIGDAAGARRQWEQALELEPGYPLARFNLGRAEAAAGRPDRAVAHLLVAVAGNPSSWLYRCELAEALLAAGRAGEALAELRTAAALDPGNARIAALLARAAGGLSPPPPPAGGAR